LQQILAKNNKALARLPGRVEKCEDPKQTLSATKNSLALALVGVILTPPEIFTE